MKNTKWSAYTFSFFRLVQVSAIIINKAQEKVLQELPPLSSNKSERGGSALVRTLSNSLWGDCVFNYDVLKVTGATYAQLEISKPQYNFDFLAHTYRETKLSVHDLTRILLPKLKGSVTIPDEIFAWRGRYYVRVAALSDDNKVVGYLSDPVCISVSDRSPR